MAIEFSASQTKDFSIGNVLYNTLHIVSQAADRTLVGSPFIYNERGHGVVFIDGSFKVFGGADLEAMRFRLATNTEVVTIT